MRPLPLVLLLVALTASCATVTGDGAGPAGSSPGGAAAGRAPAAGTSPPPPRRANAVDQGAEHARARRRARLAGLERRIVWRRSRSVGLPYAGRLVGGVRLPREGLHFFTWDPVLRRRPDRPWRRYGTARLVRTLMAVTGAYARAHPAAPRVGIADLSRPRGGDFGARFGGLGHVSHQ